MKRSLALFILPFILFTYVSFVLFQKACDYGLGSHAVKEIPFNHKSHLTDYGTDCQDCHGFYDDGRFKGIPTVGDCVACHSRDADYSGDRLTPKRKAFFDDYEDSDVPWESYAKQPHLVFSSHQVHDAAGVRCASCHGDKENSMTTDKIRGKMPMGQCENCHDALGAINTCLVCHQ